MGEAFARCGVQAPYLVSCGSSDFITSDKRSGHEFDDYDNEYQDNGADYVILGATKTQIFTFGVAWINNCTENNEVQTWFGADPTIMEL